MVKIAVGRDETFEDGADEGSRCSENSFEVHKRTRLMMLEIAHPPAARAKSYLPRQIGTTGFVGELPSNSGAFRQIFLRSDIWTKGYCAG